LALALNTEALALGICFWPWPCLGDMLVALALNVLALALYSVALLTSLETVIAGLFPSQKFLLSSNQQHPAAINMPLKLYMPIWNFCFD